jgi:hypothetical protein
VGMIVMLMARRNGSSPAGAHVCRTRRNALNLSKQNCRCDGNNQFRRRHCDSSLKRIPRTGESESRFLAASTKGPAKNGWPYFVASGPAKSLARGELDQPICRDCERYRHELRPATRRQN